MIKLSLQKNNKVLKEEEVNISSKEAGDGDFGVLVSNIINNEMNRLDPDNPFRNRETGLKVMARVHQELANAQRMEPVIIQIANELVDQLQKTQPSGEIIS